MDNENGQKSQEGSSAPEVPKEPVPQLVNATKPSAVSQTPVASQPVPTPHVEPEGAQTVQSAQPQPETAPYTTPQPSPSPVASSPVDVISANSAKPKKRVPLLVLLVLLIALLGGGGAFAYFGYYLQQPEVVWDTAMQRTHDGMKSFTEKASQVPLKDMAISGEFDLTSPVSVEGSLSGGVSKDGKTASLKGETTFLGKTVFAETRSLPAENETSVPRYFLKLSGLQDVSSLLESGPYSSIGNLITPYDNQWIRLDAETLLPEEEQIATPTFNTDEIMTATKDISAILADRLFSSDSSKSVVSVVGEGVKEDFEGAAAYKYTVQGNKDNLKSMINEVVTYLENSPLKDDLLAGEEEGTTIAQAINLEAMLVDIEKHDFASTPFTVWIDAGKKYVKNVRFTSKEDAKMFVDLGVTKVDGDNVGLAITVHGVDESGDGAVQLSLEGSSTSLDTTFGAKTVRPLQNSGQKFEFSASLRFTETVDTLTVEAPEGARTLSEIFTEVFGISPDALSDSMLTPSSVLGRSLPGSTDDTEL